MIGNIRIALLSLCAMYVGMVQAQKQFVLTSPDEKLKTVITIGKELTYEIHCNGRRILEPSPISMISDNEEQNGTKIRLEGSSSKEVNRTVLSPFYRAESLQDHYRERILKFKNGWNVEFRVYNEGIAYRFVNQRKQSFHIKNEIADFRFPSDYVASVPFVRSGNDGDYQSQYHNSFENIYTTAALSELNKQRLMFLPLVVDAGDGVKAVSYTHLFIQKV